MTDIAAAPLIQPGDEAWYLDGADMLLSSQVAVDRDTCVFAAGLNGGDYDYYDANDPRSRFYRYSRGRWTCSEVKVRIVDMMLHREPGWTENGLAVLGEDGALWFLGERGYQSRVNGHDADLLSRLRLLAGALYVAGHGGQVFRRDDDGWHHDDAGLLGAEAPVPRPRPADHGIGAFSIRDLIVTPDANDFYACGSAYVARPSLFWRPQGEAWQWLGLDAGDPQFDAVGLSRMFDESPNAIWITTNKGYLLKGNGRDGFKVATDTLRTGDGKLVSFNNIVRYGEHLYVGGTAACRLHPDGTLERLSGPPQARMGEPDMVTTAIQGALGVADGVLWAMGYGVLSRFDGRAWERISMPSVYRYPR